VLACGPAADREPRSPARELPLRAEASGPRRIVALSPQASRWVVAIGAGRRLVGVDAASSRLPALAEIPAVQWEEAADLGPDLVLVPVPPPAGDPAAERLHAQGGRWIEFAPHSLEDVFDLTRRVGAEIVGAAEALRFETQVARPLALIGGSSFGRARPRVLAVTALDPLALAGGHSFETDLIEIAGGSSLTHGGSEPRLTVIAYAIYTVTAGHSRALLATVPFVVFGVFRYLLLMHRYDIGEEPEQVLLKDVPILLAVAGWIVTAAAILTLT